MEKQALRGLAGGGDNPVRGIRAWAPGFQDAFLTVGDVTLWQPDNCVCGDGGMILEMATFLQLAAACAPQIAAQSLAAGARTESAFNTLNIHDNSTGKEYTPSSESEATALAYKLVSAGHSVDLGVMQVNSRNIQPPWGSGWLHISLNQVFDPCANVRAGAEELENWSRYNTGNPERGFRNGYVGRIVSAYASNRHVDAAAAANSPSPGQPNGSPLGVQQPHDWDVFPSDEGEQKTPEQTTAAATSAEASTESSTPPEPLGPLVVTAAPEQQDNSN